VDWYKVQEVSQNGIDWVADALTHASSTMGISHPGTLFNIEILLLAWRFSRLCDRVGSGIAMVTLQI
jgi:hypothetical protein